MIEIPTWKIQKIITTDNEISPNMHAYRAYKYFNSLRTNLNNNRTNTKMLKTGISTKIAQLYAKTE